MSAIVGRAEESREEGRLKVGLPGVKDKTQVGAEPLTE